MERDLSAARDECSQRCGSRARGSRQTSKEGPMLKHPPAPTSPPSPPLAAMNPYQPPSSAYDPGHAGYGARYGQQRFYKPLGALTVLSQIGIGAQVVLGIAAAALMLAVGGAQELAGDPGALMAVGGVG